MSLINQELLVVINESFEVLTDADTDQYDDLICGRGLDDDAYDKSIMEWVSNHLKTPINDEFIATYNHAMEQMSNTMWDDILPITGY